MRKNFAMCLAAAFLLAPPFVQAQKPKEKKSNIDVTQRYFLFPYRERDLNEAAAFGYRVLFGSPIVPDELPVAVLEKVAQPPDTYQYMMLDVRGGLNEQFSVDLLTFKRQPVGRELLEMKLNEAALQGFRLLPRTVIVNQRQLERELGGKGPPRVASTIEAVMEKPPGPVRSYQYRVLSNVPRSFLIVLAPSDFEKQMRRTAAEGFLPVGLVADNQTAILERPAVQDAPITTPPQTSQSDEKPPYLWLDATTTSALQKDLQEAAAAGYRLGGFSPQKDALAAILEKVTPSPGVREYLLLATTKVSTLQKELNEAGERGFRLLPYSLISRKPPKGSMVSFYGGLARGVAWNEIVLLMEKAAGPPNRREYQILQTTRFSTMQKELAEATGQGYAAVAGSTTGFQYTAILEKQIQ